MNPGRELDILVHEKVMGLCHHEWEEAAFHFPACRKCKERKAHAGIERNAAVPETPAYSTQMAAAWQVVEKMRLEGELVVVAAFPDGSWTVSFEKALNPRGDGTADDWDHTTPDYRFRTATPAHGICIGAVDMYLDEDALDEWRMGCFACNSTVKEGHKPTCFFQGRDTEPVSS